MRTKRFSLFAGLLLLGIVTVPLGAQQVSPVGNAPDVKDPLSDLLSAPVGSTTLPAKAAPASPVKPAPLSGKPVSRPVVHKSWNRPAWRGSAAPSPTPVKTAVPTPPATSKPASDGKNGATPKIPTDPNTTTKASDLPSVTSTAAALALPQPASDAAGTVSAPSPGTQASPAPPEPLQTKPDPFPIADTANAVPPRPMDSPMSAVGDSWKMILYLVPMLLVLVGGLRIVRRIQERTGRLPAPPPGKQRGKNVFSPPSARKAGSGLFNSLLGGFHLNTARQRGGTNIRLVESVPVGGANLHLLEVRGRTLLVGVTASGVNLLTDFYEQEQRESSEFRDLLQVTAADMDSLELSENDAAVPILVSALEDDMRETSEHLAGRLSRLRALHRSTGTWMQD